MRLLSDTNYPAIIGLIFLCALSSNLMGANSSNSHQASHPIVYNDQTIFYLVGPKDGDTKKRAKDASWRLKEIIDSGIQNMPLESPILKANRDGLFIDVSVAEKHFIRLSHRDAALLGFSDLDDLYASLEQTMEDFIRNQISANRFQKYLFATAISLLIIAVSLFSLKKLGLLFRRWEWSLSNRKSSQRQFICFGIPLISAQTKSRFVILALLLARILAYCFIVVLSVFIIARQFEATRTLSSLLTKHVLQSLMHTYDGIISSLPGIAASLLILLVMIAVIRLIRAQLDEIKNNPLTYPTISSNKVPVLKLVLPFLVVMTGAPFAIAALVGRYHSLLEYILVLVCAGAIIAGIPVMCAWCVGAVIAWREDLKCGDWVTIGRYSGEIRAINLQHIRIAPDHGGTVLIPSMYTLLNPIFRLCDLPKVGVSVDIDLGGNLTETLKTMSETIEPISKDAEISCQKIVHGKISLMIFAPSIHKNVRHDILLAIARAEEQGLIKTAR